MLLCPIRLCTCGQYTHTHCYVNDFFLAVDTSNYLINWNMCTHSHSVLASTCTERIQKDENHDLNSLPCINFKLHSHCHNLDKTSVHVHSCMHACTHTHTQEKTCMFMMFDFKNILLVWKLLLAWLIKSVSAGYKLQRVETGGERNCSIHKGGLYLFSC